MKRWPWALGLSIALHLCGAFTVSKIPPPIPRQRGGNSNEPGDQDGTEQGRSQKIKIKMGPQRGADGEIIEMSPLGKNGEPCFEYFGGVGFYHDGYGTVTGVIPGYPAARNGLQAGDQIIDVSGIIGEIGTPVTFTFFHNKVAKTITIKRERICTRH